MHQYKNNKTNKYDINILISNQHLNACNEVKQPNRQKN